MSNSLSTDTALAGSALADTKICFIGGGNMATALASGLINNGMPARNITITDIHQPLLDQHAKNLGVQTSQDNKLAIQDADAIILAVKPQVMEQVLSPLKAPLGEQKSLLISIAAGITLTSLASWLGNSQAIVRCMPNTPALVGSGATGLHANPSVSPQQKSIAQAILQSTGIVEWFSDETALDAVTAVSGSGPAYFFLVMEAMIAAGEKLGLSAQASKNLTLQTALGAAQMALEADVEVSELRRRVTSPGGTTQAAIESLQASQLEAIFEQALTAARDKSIELG